jgi:hypothetical protein
MNLKLIALLLVTTSTFSAPIKEDIQKIFPNDKVVKITQLENGVSEVQLIEKNSIVKRSNFYTNDNIDFISPQVALNINGELITPTADFEYNNLDISGYETFTVGDGDVKTHFINIVTSEGGERLNQILSGNGFKNKVFVIFDEEDAMQLLFSIPLYHGDNTQRLKNAKELILLLSGIQSKKITLDQANKILEVKIKSLRVDSSIETLDEMAQSLKIALELKSIFNITLGYQEFDGNIKSNPEAVIKTKILHQEIKMASFESYQGDLKKALDDSTAFTIGSGDDTYYLFADIDCPSCVKLDDRIHKDLKDGVKIKVLYLPLQSIHPESLDKSRFVLTFDENQRSIEHRKIHGKSNPATLARIKLSRLNDNDLKNIDSTISKSNTLAKLLRIQSTPTLMMMDKGKIVNVKDLSKILKQ